MSTTRRCAVFGLAGLALAGCRVELGPREGDDGRGGGAHGADASVVRVYSSIYKEVIEAMGPALERRLAETSPGTTIEWFQSGSEKVSARLDAELAAGGSPCDLLMTSDPAYYRRLHEEKRLVPYVSPAALKHPRTLVGPDGAWGTARVSTMVIGVSPKMPADAPKPAAFADLGRPGLRVTMGDPLSSGTFFTTIAVLSARDTAGWELFETLKKKGTIASGGNANVMQRLETGEADAGMVLLENLLVSRARGGTVETVIPRDGAVAVPGPIALLSRARRSHAARAVYDAMLSDEVQRVIVEKGFMHSPDPAIPPPAGAPALDVILEAAPESDGRPIDSSAVKSRFDAIFFR